MGIEYFAIGVIVLFSVLYLVLLPFQRESVLETVDYKKIYAELAPKELESEVKQDDN